MDKQLRGFEWACYAWIFAALAMCFWLCGCGGLIESTKNKQIGVDTMIYGFKVTAFDPETGSMAPVGAMGFGSINYRSMPVEAGQPYYARYTTKSIWSSSPASETIIWIGRAADKGVITFEAVPDTMIQVGLTGAKTGEAALKVEAEK